MQFLFSVIIAIFLFPRLIQQNKSIGIDTNLTVGQKSFFSINENRSYEYIRPTHVDFRSFFL